MTECDLGRTPHPGDGALVYHPHLANALSWQSSLSCWPHAVEHTSAQVQLSGTDVVTGIDSPDQYQTNAYFKVRADLSSLALWASAAAQRTH